MGVMPTELIEHRTEFGDHRVVGADGGLTHIE
jgi:hypothetical protein